tara:strand:+ start:243 stop:458 length:216 start_codon:yes stop_codon:yes gene_type:complete
MDKSFYRSLLLMVNDKEMMRMLQEYAAARISQYQILLEVEKDHFRVLEMQGAIKELRRIKTLRDECIAGAK